MKHFNYLMIIVAFLMMNVMNAELKTFGIPSDAETEEAPAEEAPVEEAPAEEAPTEEAPAEEAPAEEAPAEEAPAEEDEMPSASEDNQVSMDQPIKFKEEYVVSIKVGPSLPFGANLKDRFDSGMNFQAEVLTPFGFSGIDIIGHVSMFNLAATGELSENYTDYSVKNIGLKFLKSVSILDISLGTGLSLSSGTAIYHPYEDYSMTTLYISGGVSYTLPLSGVFSKVMDGKLQELEISIGVGGTEIFGAPADTGTSDMIDFGMSVSYPFLF